MNSMKNFKWVSLILGLMLTVHTASASLLLEPHVAYNLSGSGDGSGTEYDYNGPQIGARVGYQTFGFMAGLDYTHGTGDMDLKTAGVTTSRDYTTDDVGVFVGYNFPILVRAWATYYFSSEGEIKGLSELSGKTTELGVGFTGLPFLSINLVYRMVNMDESKAIATGAKSSIDQDFKEVVLGVSLPFTL